MPNKKAIYEPPLVVDMSELAKAAGASCNDGPSAGGSCMSGGTANGNCGNGTDLNKPQGGSVNPP
jgi:hypothetical protein